MGTRTSYEPGTFCWVDLVASEADGAKRFYTELFGWVHGGNDMGDGAVYSMAKRDGKRVAGLMGGQSGPPHWNSYIAVESAEDATKKAEEEGAEVVQPVIDLGGPGKMSF